MTAMPQRLPAALADRGRIERELGQGGMAIVYELTAEARYLRSIVFDAGRHLGQAVAPGPAPAGLL